MRRFFPASLSRLSLIVHAAARAKEIKPLQSTYIGRNTRDVVDASACRGKAKELHGASAVAASGKAARIKAHGDAAMHTTWKPHEKHGELT
jgi:hypothetical protein